ncbi:hypothetical protein FRB91_000113 [Serendipita sp. 411]|nr:hypothetical protein FRB91_000113 [Serendipita sp. 411]
MAPSAVQALDIDPAVVFPAPPIAGKRQLVPNLLNGLTTAVGNLGNNLLGGGNTATSTIPAATSPAAVTSAVVTTPANTPAPAPTTTSPTNNGGNNGGNNGNEPSSSNADASSSGAPVGTGSGKSTTVGGTVVPINNGQAVDSQSRTTPPQVVTDHLGNSLTITAPYTTTYVTTLPNGVVSTVTEVITPTSYISGPGQGGGLSPSKIGAVVGTLVTVFLVIFGLALLLLRLRKRKRAIQLTRSRPASASSFGSATDEFAYEERRSSRSLLVSSTTTVPAVVEGSTMNFPLPPLPTMANSSSNRPVSMLSNQTFDLAFEQQTKSRSSLIADRNLFRKIGEYPEAGTYTPFAVPPSDTSHAEQAISPTQLNRALERQHGYNEVHRVSQTDKQLVTENPFSDPIATSTQSPTTHAQILSNTEARRTTLWRKATFGSSVPSNAGDATKSPSMRSTTTSDYGTALSHSDVPEERPTSDVPSDGGYSYHSAFEAYAQGKRTSKEAENPFADPQKPMGSNDTITPAKIGYPTLRPGTGKSSGSSSVASSVPASREMGATPDPKKLFYQAPTSTSRSELRNSTTSESSVGTATSDEEGTIRGHSVSYAYPIPPSVARLQSDTAAP